MSELSCTGTIIYIGKEQQVSEKFKKQEFVLEDRTSQYPQKILFQLTQDRCSLLKNFKVGDEIKVLFNLRGREWANPNGGEVKYFNTLEAWKLVSIASGSEPQNNVSEPQVNNTVTDPQDPPF